LFIEKIIPFNVERFIYVIYYVIGIYPLIGAETIKDCKSA